MIPTPSRPLPILLNSLEHAELIRQLRLGPELEYLFKHGLVQESAYDSLLRTDRRHLHRLVAESLERSSEGQNESALRLAQHWDHAGEAQRAFNNYLRAGDQASQIYAHTEALMAYDRACTLAEELALPAAERLPLFVARGRVLEHQGAYPTALEDYATLEQLARAEGDHPTELQALIHRTTLFATPNTNLDSAEAQRLSLGALSLARAMGDRPAEAKVLWNLLLTNFAAGQNVEAVRYGEGAVTIARELDLREQLAFTLNDLARPLLIIGRAEEAEAAMTESQALWRELKNLPMLADNLIGTGMYAFFTGNYHGHPSNLEEGLQISQDLGNLWGLSYAHETLGLLYVQTGEFALALQHLWAAAEFGSQVNYVYGQYDGLVFAAIVYDLLGAKDEARRVLEMLLSNPDAQPDWLTQPRLVLAQLQADAGDFTSAWAALEQSTAALAGTMGGFGLILLHFAKTYVFLVQFQPKAALAESRLGLEELSKNDVRPFKDVLLYYQALAFELLSQLNDAVLTAESALREAAETGGRAWLWEICATLARLYAKGGKTDSASEMKQKAVAEVQFIAAHAPPEFRDSLWKRAERQGLSRLTS